MEEEKSSRKYNSHKRKKISDKIKKIKNKSDLVEIFKIVNRDIGDNFSENKSGIYFNINLLSDDGVNEILKVIENIESSETQSEVTDEKIKYTSYSENEIDVYNSLGPRLSNQEKSILKKFKNIN
tara:strand:- start:84 stop:458 length:375 start_codon:yes stop_codon:yes gene_type:complete